MRSKKKETRAAHREWARGVEEGRVLIFFGGQSGRLYPTVEKCEEALREAKSAGVEVNVAPRNPSSYTSNNKARFGDIDQRRVGREELEQPTRDLGALLRRTGQQKFANGDVVAIFGKSQGMIVGEGVIKSGREKVYIIHLQEPFIDRHGVTHSTTVSGSSFLRYVGRLDPRTGTVVPEDRPLPP